MSDVKQSFGKLCDYLLCLCIDVHYEFVGSGYKHAAVGHEEHIGRRVIYRGHTPHLAPRAGIALLIAAMSARGTSRIDNIEQIDRGYEDIEVRLNSLGAKISRMV